MARSSFAEIKEKLERTEDRIVKLQDGYQSILEFIDKMEQLIQFQEKVDIPYDFNQVWNVFLGHIQHVIDIDVCALFIVEEDTHEFALKSVYPEDKGSISREEMDFQIECGVFPWVIKRRKPAIIPSLAFRNEKTIIMLPLSTLKRTLGVVFILASIKESNITKESLKLLTMLAKQCSLVIENTVLYERLKKEHESLQEAQAQILQAEKLASIGRLTAGAFHEILNPLNIISGHLQYLLMDKNLSPRASKYLTIMGEQSRRITNVVKGLLQFSRRSEGKRGEVNVNELIEKALSLVEYETKFDKIDIIKTLDFNAPSITGDGEKLSQVIFSFISNARDAMPQGGTLRIATKVAEENSCTSDNGACVEVTFEDTGCGIKAGNIDKVFDPFFTTKETGNGTGLELSISYGIIQDHGGSVRVASKENEGTKFTVCLPTNGGA